MLQAGVVDMPEVGGWEGVILGNSLKATEKCVVLGLGFRRYLGTGESGKPCVLPNPLSHKVKQPRATVVIVSKVSKGQFKCQMWPIL